jgi:methionyl-tRNA synthetase
LTASQWTARVHLLAFSYPIRYVADFQELNIRVGITNDSYIRTTSEKHKVTAPQSASL